MSALISEILKAHEAALRGSLSGEGERALIRIAGLLAEALGRGRKVLLAGNGGSAADAQHAAAELVGRFKKERRGLPAVSLAADTSILTAIGNDSGFDQVFARQVEALGEVGDVLIAISTSGNSKNILEAVRRAKARGMTTVGFTGEPGGALVRDAHMCFAAKSADTPRIQEVHGVALHAVCELVENALEK